MGEGWLSWDGDEDRDLGLTVKMTKGLGSWLVSGFLTMGPSALRRREMSGKGVEVRDMRDWESVWSWAEDAEKGRAG